MTPPLPVRLARAAEELLLAAVETPEHPLAPDWNAWADELLEVALETITGSLG